MDDEAAVRNVGTPITTAWMIFTTPTEAAQGSLIHLTRAQPFGVAGTSRRNQINFHIAFEVQ